MTKRPQGPLRGLAALTLAGTWALFVVAMLVIALLWLFGYGDYIEAMVR